MTYSYNGVDAPYEYENKEGWKRTKNRIIASEFFWISLQFVLQVIEKVSSLKWHTV